VAILKYQIYGWAGSEQAKSLGNPTPVWGMLTGLSLDFSKKASKTLTRL
jgi:hypothetical protein